MSDVPDLEPVHRKFNELRHGDVIESDTGEHELTIIGDPTVAEGLAVVDVVVCRRADDGKLAVTGRSTMHGPEEIEVIYLRNDEWAISALDEEVEQGAMVGYASRLGQLLVDAHVDAPGTLSNTGAVTITLPTGAHAFITVTSSRKDEEVAQVTATGCRVGKEPTNLLPGVARVMAMPRAPNVYIIGHGDDEDGPPTAELLQRMLDMPATEEEDGGASL